MNLGCSTLLYGGHGLDRALGSIAAIGYRAIELCSIPGMADHVSPGGSKESHAALRRAIADAGLAVESIGASSNLLDPASRARFEALMEAAAELGAPAITSGSGGAADGEDSFRQVLDVLHALGDKGKALRVKVSIKPHVRAAIYNTATSIRAMKELDHRWVGLNVDASHLWRANEDPEKTIPDLLSYVVTGRIRDTLSRDIPIGPVETQIPGDGAMNLPAICAVFKRRKGLRYLTLEIVGTKDFTFEEVERVARVSYEKLRPLVE